MSVAFLFGVLWKGTTARAINSVLTVGTAFCLLIGILYLWVLPGNEYPWPHFLLLSFYLFVVLSAQTFLISYFDKKGQAAVLSTGYRYEVPKASKKVWTMWGLLIAVMIALYIIFNGH
jgi:SSS family solute:Na+ symporter